MIDFQERLQKLQARDREETKEAAEKLEQLDEDAFDSVLIEQTPPSSKSRPELRFVSTSGREWNRGDVISLANPNCTLCNGLGGRSNFKVNYVDGAIRYTVCRCVLRACFRQCLARYQQIIYKQSTSGTSSSFEGTHYARKEENYVADFELVGRRYLADRERKVLQLHIIEECEWMECVRHIKGLDRGSFFHALYRVEEMLGRIFHELEPFALHPLRDYFGTRTVVKASVLKRSLKEAA